MTRISDMTPLATLPATGAYVPVEKAGSTTNYRYDLSGLSSSYGLFANASSLSIPTGTDMVSTTGYSTLGVGSANYIYDAAVDAAYVAAHPRASFISANNRGFRLDREQDFTPEMFGATGSGGADDSAALAAAVAFVLTPGMPGVLLFPTPSAYYRCDSQLNLESTLGLTLRGPGGRVEPVTDTPPCAIVYTGTATSFVKAGKSHGLTIEGLAIQVSNASFTGDIITLDNDGAAGAVTYSTSIVNCMVGGRTSAARFARSCINAQGAVELYVDLNTFGWADRHVISHVATGLAAFSNAVTITRNRFNQHNIHAVNIFKGEQWLIDDNVFEQQYGGSGSSGVAAAISDLEIGGSTHGPCSAQITNNGFWDCDSGIWIDIYAWGQTIAGNRSTLGAGATFVRFNGGAGGKLSGNRVNGLAGSKFMDFAVSPVAGLDDDGSNLVDGAVTYNANLTGFTPPDRAARDMSVRSSTATAIAGVGGFYHARKAAAGAGAFGGGFYFDRNDDTNWRGGGVFSYLDPVTSKECIAFTVAAATTAPTDTSLIVGQLTQDGDLKLPGTAIRFGANQVVGVRKTGWAVDTGTAKRTANATYSGTAEVGYTQATVQTLMDAVRDLSQTVKALKDDLHGTAGHGLIGT